MSDTSPFEIKQILNRQRASLWPSEEYNRQLALLRSVVGNPINLVEVKQSDIYLTLTFSSRPVTLLDIVDYPAPDPERQLYPHIAILDDGRGLNLGRIARVSLNQAYNPDEDELFYQDILLLKQLLHAPRRLSEDTIRNTSKAQLAKLLGKTSSHRLEQSEQGDT